jgi:hypothetical protein
VERAGLLCVRVPAGVCGVALCAGDRRSTPSSISSKTEKKWTGLVDALTSTLLIQSSPLAFLFDS